MSLHNVMVRLAAKSGQLLGKIVNIGRHRKVASDLTFLSPIIRTGFSLP